MSGSGYLHRSNDPFEKMVIFPPDPLSYVIVPRCSRGFQDPGHKTPSQGFMILIHVQGYIQDYDVARCGAYVIPELTQWSGSLTRLASDLGQACQKFICTVPF